MSSIIRLRSGLTVLVSLMESSFLFEACSTSILRTGALHCYHYYILSTGSRPLGSCSRTAGWSAATSCYGPSRHFGAWPNLVATGGIADVNELHPLAVTSGGGRPI